MPAHQPVLPARAVDLVEARNLDAAKSLLADFAAAGLIKTYALVREIRPAEGPIEIFRDSQIPSDEWDRIVASGKISAAFNGGTVRLEGSALRGGAPAILITGISFSEASLIKVLDRYCAAPPIGAAKKTVNPGRKAEEAASSSSCQNDKLKGKVVPPIRPGDLTASIAQTMQATGLGRTKVDELMQERVLVRRKVGSRTLITVESIERLVGTKVAR
ncbi:MAG: hypothetical protein V2J51_16890 [Erythrobacter sp.]|jgi:hypothetical protein|nr:hypothetical protein [Erythrobacter sp.]